MNTPPTPCAVIALPPGFDAVVCQVCGWHERYITAANVRWRNCPACGQSFTGPQRRRQLGAIIPRVERVEGPDDPGQWPGSRCQCPARAIIGL